MYYCVWKKSLLASNREILCMESLASNLVCIRRVPPTRLVLSTVLSVSSWAGPFSRIIPSSAGRSFPFFKTRKEPSLREKEQLQGKNLCSACIAGGWLEDTLIARGSPVEVVVSNMKLIHSSTCFINKFFFFKKKCSNSIVHPPKRTEKKNVWDPI